jgi:vitamin B12 transporter
MLDVTAGAGGGIRLRFFCLGLLSVLTLPCAAAHDDLGEIVVTARQPVVSSVATVHKVDATEIQLRGDTNLGDVMEMIAGVNVRVGGQGVSRIDVRGLRTRHIKLLINGVLFNSTFDGQFDPNQFPPELMQQVKVTTGGVSELYGSGAMAVVNVITPFTSDSPLTITGELGEDSNSRFSFSSGGSQGNVDYYVTAATRQRDGFPLSSGFKPTVIEDGGVRENSDRKANNLFANFVYRPTANLTTGLIAMAFSGDYGLPPNVVDDPTNIFASRTTYERVEDQLGYAAQGSFDYDADNGWFTRGWLYGNRLQQHENRYDDATYSGISDVSQRGNYLTTTRTEIGGLGLQAGKAFTDRLRLTVGVDYHHDNWHQNGIIRDVAAGGGGGGGGGGTLTTYDLRTLNNDYSLENGSLSGEFEIEPLDRLGLVIGGGYHWQTGDMSISDSSWSFLGAAHYAVTETLGLRASWSRKVRPPSIRQYFDESRGNLDLKFEKVETAEGGVVYRPAAANWSLEVAAYHMDVKNFIERNEATNLFDNVAASTVYGVDVSGSAVLFDRLRLRGSYSYMHSKDETSSGRDELQNRPENMFVMDADYDLGTGFGMHMKMRYIADQVYYSRTTPLVKAQLPDFTVVDARLRWQARDNVELHIGVDNLFDENYEEEVGFPRPGRFVYGGFKWSL